MMDPATARLALKLQLDDVDAILKSLSPASKGATAAGEVAAFQSLREELIRKWHEINGRCLAHNILREENSNRVAFTRLLSEEQQAERDHDMACRLAGMPVPRRAPAPNKRPQDEAERQTTAINGATTGSNVPRVGLGVSRTAATLSTPCMKLKRIASQHLTSGTDKKAATQSAIAGKHATVEDAPDDESPTATSLPAATNAKKRVAFVDPAVLREHDDGRTKRMKPDATKESASFGLDGATVANSAPKVTTAATPINHGDSNTQGTCASCLDLHSRHNMLQLDCKDEGDHENHAYCRDCLLRLFESSVTDPSHFPPRCCSKIISLFACTPFLPQALIGRFVARREELGTPNRTYCSNNECSKWIHPTKIVASVAVCLDCGQKTCATCKAKHHNGLCPEDKAVKDLLNVARQKRWQTCPNCKEMVELERGCYHITCRCRHEFCYLCVGKWKTCKCPTWDERNIIDAPQPPAGQAAAAPAPLAAPAPAARAAPVANPLPAANHVPAIVLAAAAPRLGLFAPHAWAAPAPPAAVPQAQIQPPRIEQAGNRNRNRRARRERHRPRPHEHDFERYYRSMDWDTECHLCGHEDRWVNCCSECDLKVCWYCTKHRV